MKTQKKTARYGLTHVNQRGEANMVNVGDKVPTRRIAVAEARVKLGSAAHRALSRNKKGDVFAAVRLAGIAAAKKTSDLIPLCHPLFLSHVTIDIKTAAQVVQITARAETIGTTGVEMEAMTAASVAALTLYDMLKAVEKGIVIENVRLLRKEGGKSGLWKAKV